MMSETFEVIASPYPGLRPFRMDEDYLFFGREEQTAELVKLLREHRFLAVVGRSGSGKSSLVRAGLLPAIQGGMMQHMGSAWEIAVLRPGGHPIRNLAECLIDADLYDPEDEEALPRLLATLNHSALGLEQAYRQSEIEDDTNLLIVVDQFEELFRFEQDGRAAKDEAHAFVELLLEASRSSDAKIYVVLTMRSDYLGDCAQVPGLAEAVNLGEYLIPRLERAQLRVAIEGPAKVGGGAVAYRLVQHLLNELGDEEDQLPVLQHALMRTWSFWQDDHTEGDEIDLQHYESSGGMKLAISNHADEVFDRLPDDEHREFAERLFRTLTVKGDDNRGVRRPTRLDQLTSVSGENLEVVRAVIDAYRAPGVTFLMPGVDVELKEDSVIDLSHESLMRVWQRLRRWVDTEAQSARIYKRLVDTAELHAEKKAGLYHNPDLEITLAWRDDENPNEAWANQYGGGFSRAISFLEQSEQQARRIEEEVEKSRQRELQQAKELAESRARSTVLLKRFAAVVGGACLVAVMLAAWAMKQSRVAQENALVAERETMRANAEEKKAKQSAQKATELAVEAQRLEAQAVEAASMAKLALGKTWLTTAKSFADGSDRFSARLKAARALGFTGHGRDKLATNLQERFPVLLKQETPEWREAEKLVRADSASHLLWTSGLQPQHEGQITGVARHPSLPIIASISSDDLGVQLWDGESGEKLRLLDTRIQSSPLASTAVSAIAFSPDGKYFVAAADQIEVFTLDDDGRFTRIEGDLPQVRRSITSLAFRSDGELLALADREGAIYLWKDWKSNAPIPIEATLSEIHGTASINSLAFHPTDKHLLAIGGNRNGVVTLLDTVTGNIEHLEPVETQDNKNNRVHSLSFSPDGKWLAVGGESIPVTLWDVGRRQPLTTLLDNEWSHIKKYAKDGSESLRMVSPSVAFSSDGTRLAVSWYHEAVGNELRYYPETLSVFDFATGSAEPILDKDIVSDAGPFQRVLFDHRDDVLLLASAGRLTSWDLKEGCPTKGEPAAHSGPIESLAFSRDGFYFASGDIHGFIRIWDAKTGELLHTLEKHWGSIRALEFSADSSKLFACGFRDRMITAWDVSSGMLVDSIDFEIPIFSFDLTADGKTLLAGGWYDRFFAYDTETLALEKKIKAVRGSAPFLSPDGKQVFALNNTRSSSLDLYQWADDGSLEVVNQWRPLHDSFWVDIAIHPAGNLMVIAFADGSVKTFARQLDQTWTESPQVMLAFRDEDVTQVQFDPRGRHLIIGTYGGETKIWDLASEQLLEVLPGTQEITALIMSPNGELLLTGDIDGMIHVWAMKKNEPEPVLVGTQIAPHPICEGSRDIVLAPERRLLFSTGAYPQLNDVIAWKIDHSRLTRAYTLEGRKTQPGFFAISPDERLLAAGPMSGPGELTLWDLETGESRQLAQVLAAGELLFSPDGKLIAGCGNTGPESPSRVSLWDVTKGGDAIAETPLLPGPTLGITFTPDGTQLVTAVAKEGHPVQFWDIDPETRTLSLADEFPTPPHRAMKMTLNRAGNLLAVAFSGGGGWIWDLAKSGNSPSEVIRDGALFGFAFGPDDRMLATGGFAGHLQILDDGTPRNVIASAPGGGKMWDVVSDLIFDVDGQTLFVSRTDGMIFPWRIADARSAVLPVNYLSLFDLEEASGELFWNNRNTQLSPPTTTMAFSPLQNHYLSELSFQTEAAEPLSRLFESYLNNDLFLAAEGLLLSMDPEVAAGLEEQLTTTLAEQLIQLESEQSTLDCNLELGNRLFDRHPDQFAVRLARCTQLGAWSQADELLTQELKLLPASVKKRHVRHFFTALDAQVSRLANLEESIDERDSKVPPITLILASTLNSYSRALDDALARDALRGFAAEMETPAGEALLDQIATDEWETKSIFDDVVSMLQSADLQADSVPWLEAVDGDLAHDQPDSPRLWRLRARIYEYLDLNDQALAAARSRLDTLASDHSPAAIRESKCWLQWTSRVLEKVNASADEIDAVYERWKSVPVRSSGLDPKMIDLTDYYTQNLFGKPDLGRLPESFTPLHEVSFDLRGVIRLSSALDIDVPDRVDGIAVGQKSEVVHFLMGARGGHKADRIDVAKLVVHFDDGSTSTIKIVNRDHISDWLQWLDNYRLTNDQKGWSGRTGDPWREGLNFIPCALSEVIWKNPKPESTISHIDFVSEMTEVEPFIVAITLE